MAVRAHGDDLGAGLQLIKESLSQEGRLLYIYKGATLQRHTQPCWNIDCLVLSEHSGRSLGARLLLDLLRHNRIVQLVKMGKAARVF